MPEVNDPIFIYRYLLYPLLYIFERYFKFILMFLIHIVVLIDFEHIMIFMMFVLIVVFSIWVYIECMKSLIL